ncbi:hypothetical protein G6F68_018307 [Rhizopus microsporus]|nr:hypothetical protein G6F68_018307 [Rhizopus microsporus]
MRSGEGSEWEKFNPVARRQRPSARQTNVVWLQRGVDASYNSAFGEASFERHSALDCCRWCGISLLGCRAGVAAASGPRRPAGRAAGRTGTHRARAARRHH